ncbi:hypothetical protein E2C01_043578 [Portunus trituberculatus]|uniref:Uncharacterized protein n=1 Tax=Portunus trituberculatus TaxID=210409 RepID=A0A5B7FZY5_PORTR|nr:hypothetical protein [Portunus trituberculatus]
MRPSTEGVENLDMNKGSDLFVFVADNDSRRLKLRTEDSKHLMNSPLLGPDGAAVTGARRDRAGVLHG